MNILVDGIRVTLTDKQVEFVKKQKAKILSDANSFRKVLIRFGFRGIKGQKGSYQSNFAYAEIINRGNYNDVWMVGSGLKDSKCFPGGWVYSSPKELLEELIKSNNPAKL